MRSWPSLAIAAALLAVGCHGKRERIVSTTSAGDAGAGATNAGDGSAGGAFMDGAATVAKELRTRAASDAIGRTPEERACRAVDKAKIAPFVVDRGAITAAVPPVVDAKGSLAPFYDRVLGLARGEATSHVRIGVYGDSNLTTDHLTGHLRRALQGRFGDAGHGFIALARTWPWYAHEDVRQYGTWPLFKQMACTTDPVFGHRYGFANMAAESKRPGAWAYVGTTHDPASPIGKTASRFDVYFLKQPRGGSFDLQLDGKTLRTVSTAAADFQAGFELIETDDGPHEVRCLLKGDGTVRLFGTTLERSSDAGQASVVVDSLGAGALNFQRFLMTESAIRKTQLARRKYDVIAVWLGMNVMWLEPNRAWVHETIKTLRDAIPDVPIVLIAPPDSVKMGERRSDPRIVGIVRQLREVAAEDGVAFWDFREAMGGDASYLDFMKRGLAANDRAHLSQAGSALMGQRFLAALFDGVAARLEAVPNAGCAPGR